jgi:hypothetical protein
MKHWLNQNYKTLIITAFLIPIITVAIVSISHVTKWYGISNPVSWAIYLSIGIEIAALSALAAISANMGKKVYFPFAVVTVIQFIGNIFFAYSYIDIDGQLFKDWVGLVSPLVEFMGVDANDFVGHKRFLAFFAGGMLPIISLSFLHMLVKFTEEDRLNEKIVDTKESNPEDLKDFVDESSRIHLSDNDLKILEDVLLNPQGPNEELLKAAEKYKRRGELLSEIIKNDEELGLYNEPFGNPLIKEDDSRMDIIGQNGNEGLHYDIEPSITPQTPDVSDWDVTLMDGLEDEEPFFTEEEMEKILQEEPTEEEIQRNFSTIEPETENIFHKDEFVPSMSDEEIMEMNQREYERDLDTEEDFDGFVPEPFATPEEVKEFKIDETIDTSSENEDEKKN